MTRKIKIGVIVVVTLMIMVGAGYLRYRAIQRSQYVADARAALAPLQSLQSLVNIGINYSDYHRRVGEARIELDRFLRKYPSEQTHDDILKMADVNIELAQLEYEQAEKIWDAILKAKEPNMPLLNSRRNVSWTLADNYITDADHFLAGKYGFANPKSGDAHQKELRSFIEDAQVLINKLDTLNDLKIWKSSERHNDAFQAACQAVLDFNKLHPLARKATSKSRTIDFCNNVDTAIDQHKIALQAHYDAYYGLDDASARKAADAFNKGQQCTALAKADLIAVQSEVDSVAADKSSH